MKRLSNNTDHTEFLSHSIAHTYQMAANVAEQAVYSAMFSSALNQ